MADQLPLPGPDYIGRAAAISKKAGKARRSSRLVVLQQYLGIDSTFAATATAGVPRTRAECPTVRPCPHVLCRHHLLLEDADTRAGRPGLASVPRDARGATLPVTGDAGAERPGTTLRPGWLRVMGLEIEREVRVFLWRGDGELEVSEGRNGTLDYWLARLHPGEPVLVFDDDTGAMIAKAHLEERGLVFDRELPETAFGVVLTRVRGVSTCALDEIDRKGKHSNTEVGDAIGRHRTLAARVLRQATASAIRRARAAGMTKEELMQGLRELSGNE